MKLVNVICVTLTKALTKKEGSNVSCDSQFLHVSFAAGS